MSTRKLTFHQEATAQPPPPLTFLELWDACVDVAWSPYPVVVAIISGYRIGGQPSVYRVFSFGRSSDPRDFDTRDAAFTYVTNHYHQWINRERNNRDHHRH